MRLFHVSEEPDIKEFVPRIPYREDMDKSKGLVWALTEPALPNFLTPRDCPRVGYRVKEDTAQEDIERYFSSASRHCVAIEHGWHEKMLSATLYVYEFDPEDFYFHDTAGFYVSEKTETPISTVEYGNLYGELFDRGVEVRLLSNLWELRDSIFKSTLNYSFCRMHNAKPRPGETEGT